MGFLWIAVILLALRAIEQSYGAKRAKRFAEQQAKAYFAQQQQHARELERMAVAHRKHAFALRVERQYSRTLERQIVGPPAKSKPAPKRAKNER